MSNDSSNSGLQEQSNKLLSVALYFRLTAEDKRRLQILADLEHLTISEYLRKLINDAWATISENLGGFFHWLDRAKITEIDQKTFDIIEKWLSRTDIEPPKPQDQQE